MKLKLQRDKVVSIVNGKDLVGVYVMQKKINPAVDENEYEEILLAEMHPTKADKIIGIWNSDVEIIPPADEPF